MPVKLIVCIMCFGDGEKWSGISVRVHGSGVKTYRDISHLRASRRPGKPHPQSEHTKWSSHHSFPKALMRGPENREDGEKSEHFK